MVQSLEFKRLAWGDLRVSSNGLHVRRLELHRHLRETAKLGRHQHAHWQSILYLGGQGWEQVAEGQPVVVRAGSLLILPPGVEHGFLREGRRPPFCLVADFELATDRDHAPFIGRLTAPELARIRRLIASAPALDSQRNPDDWERAGLALQVVSLQLKASGWWGERIQHLLSPIAIKAERLLRSRLSEPEPLQELAKAIGFSPDHLNRVLRQEVGWTLGEWRTLLRLEHAKKRLRDQLPVAEVAAQCGMFDQNYFARWFRKATGLSPTEWRREPNLTSSRPQN